MGVTRIVPDLPVADVHEAGALYTRLFGLDVAMDIGWVANLGPADAPAIQLQFVTADAAAPCNPAVSIGVDTPEEVDAIHRQAVDLGLDIVHPPTDEEWGVRRFFFRDRDGNVVNVVANR